MFERALYNEFRRRDIDKQVAAIVTQVLVDLDDPAFESPSKPIGSFMDQRAAYRGRDEEGWVVVEDAGRGWRRVVPSPMPQEIIQRQAILALVEARIVTICVGGGGIPVVRNDAENLVGVEAVIDKDFASSLLASSIDADLFLVSTSVEKVALNYNSPKQQWLDRVSLEEAERYLAEGHFAAGSMGPKIQAIIDYLRRGGRHAIITTPENIGRALRGEAGTHFTC